MEVVREEAGSEGGLCGAAAGCGKDVGLERRQGECLVGVEGGPAWGQGGGGDLQVTR